MDCPVVKLIVLLSLLFLPGWFTLAAARKKGGLSDLSRSDFLFLSLAISFSLSSLFGLVLAQAGLFSVLKVTILQIIYSLIVLIFFRPSLALPPPSRGGGRLERFILPLILVLAAILFFRPVEYIFGGWDPGVYANTAVHLARTGSTLIDDPFFGSLPPETREVFSQGHSSGYPERYPGFRLSTRDAGRVIPQFYRLFPVWLAVFYGLWGLKGVFYLTPFLGLLSLLAVYCLVRGFWGRKAAWVASFLLALNLVQIWQARFPTSEILSQFLLFSGLFIFSRFLDRGERFMGWLAGTVLGLFVLSRVSGLLLFVPLLVFFYLRWFVSFKKEELHFWIPLLLLTVYSLLPHFLLDPRYLTSSVGALRLSGTGWTVFAAVLPLGAVAARLLPRRGREKLFALASGEAVRWVGVGAVVVLAWYGYFIRPYIAIASADKANLVELGWLLTAPGLALGCLGICLLVRRNRNPAAWLFLLILLTYSGLFLWQQMIHYYYMWAARRYAVVVVPGFIVCAAMAIMTMVRGRSRAVRLLAVGAFLFFALFEVKASRPIFAHRGYGGAVDFMEDLAGRLEGADLVVVEGKFVDKLPTVLDLTYGYKVLPVYPPGGMYWPLVFEAVHEIGPDPLVYLLTDQTPPGYPGLDFVPSAVLPFHAAIFERRADRLPQKVDEEASDANFTVKIYRVVQRRG